MSTVIAALRAVIACIYAVTAALRTVIACMYAVTAALCTVIACMHAVTAALHTVIACMHAAIARGRRQGALYSLRLAGPEPTTAKKKAAPSMERFFMKLIICIWAACASAMPQKRCM